MEDEAKKSLCEQGLKQADLSAFYETLTRIPSAPNPESFSLASSLHAASIGTAAVALSGLIVETRRHRNLESVILTVSKHLRVPILLLHGEGNRDLVRNSKRLQKLVSQRRLVTQELPVQKLTRADYNALFLSRKLWEATIPSEKVLVFQTDATLCRLSPYRIEEFWGFDYIGSYRPNPRPIGAHVNGGNGGLSLRSRSAMLASLEYGSPELWPGGEDDYFGSHIELIDGRVGDVNSQKAFSSQRVFERRSFGIHNPQGIGRGKFLLMLLYCPSALRCHRGTILRVQRDQVI